ncbi:MAG: type II toxin-antitoxin system PemK/MazF family toxin [Patescibacteria group bacterium]|nr:type II toxin-antitoxin system PemK/MazF family toxin [Patescibacteria group bacterium]
MSAVGSNILRGHIYWVTFDPTVGSEIRKTRPALVISNNVANRYASTVTVIPLTSNTSQVRPFEVLITAPSGGLDKDSKAKADQIRTVDKQRLSTEPLGGPVSNEILVNLTEALKIHLDI